MTELKSTRRSFPRKGRSTLKSTLERRAAIMALLSWELRPIRKLDKLEAALAEEGFTITRPTLYRDLKALDISYSEFSGWRPPLSF